VERGVALRVAVRVAFTFAETAVAAAAFFVPCAIAAVAFSAVLTEEQAATSLLTLSSSLRHHEKLS